MEKSRTSIAVGVIIFVVIIVVAFAGLRHPNEKQGTSVVPSAGVSSAKNDPKNISYRVDGQSIALVNGKFEHEAAPGSAAKETFAIFGAPVYGDLNGDGDDSDAAMYLTRDAGGSGTFYYVAFAINEHGAYQGTDAVFLGDRIAPQNINIQDGNAVANFAERKTGEAFTVQPSVGKSVWVHFDPKTQTIGEQVKDFEGDADPGRMTLGMKSWEWDHTEYVKAPPIAPKKSGVFSISFSPDGTLTVKTDCNAMGGTYVVKGNVLTFGPMTTTLKFCEGSQEGEFSGMLAVVVGYHFTSKGELYLEMKDNTGSIIFR